ncbi:trypsin-like serine protease [Jiangella rhizosphaerae]|uniref:Serine protease n=1 Tax=Jiangella rhizosphaerae TaxID=2293569 RepID=A0A418KVA1_9ACTN|nr:trypsin-like serine protease [Jiangella rhizosphaerae]RIQ34160.1 serine protease [Jiangella rhizosphaerae]
MTTFRARARIAGALLAAVLTGATVVSTAGTAAAAEEVPVDAQISVEKADIESRIVGGEDAPEGEYPFIGQLRVDFGNGTYGSCGASLYDEEWVLTAAHCVAEIGGSGPTDVVTVGFGSLNQSELNWYQAEYVYSANISGIPNDWALVKLAEPVDPADATPVEIVSDTSYDEVEEFTVIGWGDLEEGANAGSEELQQVQVPFVSDEECAAGYGDNLTPDAELCAGAEGIDSCQGDSGGPLLAEVTDGEYIQVGVVSWGNGCAQAGFPGIYTQLSAFSDNIAAVAAGNVPAEVTDIAVETTAGTPVEIVFEGTDADDDELSYKVTDASNGELTTEDPENVTSVIYTPAEGFTGEDSFLYVANDGNTDGIPATVTITVTEAEEPTETPTPTPTEEPTSEPTATPTEDPGDDDGDGEELPDTGSSTTTMIGLALLLAAGGAGAAFAARRRVTGSNV